MKNSSRFYLLLVLISLLAVFSACDRQPYPMGNVDKPQNPPEYSVGTDINKSPAVGVTPVTAH